MECSVLFNKKISMIISAVLVMAVTVALTSCGIQTQQVEGGIKAFVTEVDGSEVLCLEGVDPAVFGQGGSSVQPAPATNTPAPATTAAAAPVTNSGAATATTAAQTPATTAASAAPAEAPATTQAAAPAPASSDPSTPAEILAVYNDVYNKTKATGTFLGRSEMKISDITIDGNSNGLVAKAAEAAVNGTDENLVLPPSDDAGNYMTSILTEADIASITYKDNGDGTATIHIVPHDVTNPKKGKDSQGRMFNVVDDFGPMLEEKGSVLSLGWAQGDAASNCTAVSSGWADVTFDKNTHIMTKAQYDLKTQMSVTHLNVLFLKDKSVAFTTDYLMTFPM